ncbi:MAG: tRNA 2-thiouridine(34) synthase MnmA [Solirubrobacterales bacterium]|nr:tRNA 2-thiouridine(34) synthase MnmA [Solirubrobacterales bacterium]
MESLLAEYVADRSHEADAPEGAFTGAAGGAACGDLARISLVISEGRIESAGFGTEGCAATRAACACACELVEGESVLEAARIGADRIEDALGGLSPARRHAAMLTADALHRALSAAASSGETLSAPVPGRVLVAVSGGVDSAVAALRERERGADVVAVTVKLWADPDTDGTKACCSPEAVLGARSLTHELGIPHLTLDLEGPFRERVVGEFLQGYSEGRTPNPCVLCNGEVRIAAMVALADRLGAEELVTGHYARVVEDEGGALIAAGSDESKDQSYMLAALPPEVVSRLRFPLADLSKTEVRAIAERGGLTVAKKPESQDLCFLAGQSKKDFLRRHGGLDDRPGPVVDVEGRRLGEHPGHHHFTVGQRRGLGVAATEPLYVLGTDAGTNTVRVGSRSRLSTDRVRLRDAVMYRDGTRVDRVRLRYHTEPVPAKVAASAGRHERLELELERPFDGPAPGQAAVLMSGDVVVGHATIASQSRVPVS